MSERNDATLPKIALAVGATLVMLYSLLVATRPLLGAFIVVGLLGVYLVWRFFRLAVRFVHAVERIADALERGEAR